MSLTVHGPPNPRDEDWQEYWRHWTASVSEGLCPEHRTALEAVTMRTAIAAPNGRIAGHCPSCHRFWGINRDTEQAGWWLDWEPGRFSVPVPGWMAT